MSKQDDKVIEVAPANGEVKPPAKDELVALKADLEQQRDERIAAICNADPMLREIVGALKGLDYALARR